MSKICPGCEINHVAPKFKFCTLCLADGTAKTYVPPAPVVEEVVVDEVYTAPIEEPQFPTVEINYNDPSIQELAKRTLARRGLLGFIQRFKPKYDAGWVHKDICRRLERFMKDVEDGKEPRLLLMMPVRHGKSEIASRHFAPWVLGKHPDWEIIAASGAQSLAMSFSRYIRDLVRDPSYQAVFPTMRLDPSSQSVENWNSTSGGGYLAAGIGTMITGRGAHILIIDDPVKDAEAADSQGQRDATWEWYMSTAYTRLAPGGGVLGIMCMTGDTPVLMADGTQRRLATLSARDEIATYARGTLARTTVAAMRSSGRDLVLKITMRDGKIVRANQRHPFLTVAPSGEVSWTRVQNLTTAHKIATLKGSGANGQALHALPRGATSLPSVADFATVTIPSRSGLQGTEHLVRTTSHAATPDLSTATALLQRITTLCTTLSKGVARYAAYMLRQVIAPDTGKKSSQWTTATTQARSEDCCATTATQESDILVLSQWHLPPLGTSDFTLGQIVSIEPDGVEEVFDVQVTDTENFIANGLVTHNTWWNDDDWAGRIQQSMATESGDMFEIVKYPAINDLGDEYILPDDSMVQLPEGSSIPEGAVLTRVKGTALHPERYTVESLLKRKASYYALGQQRWWSALYQQNPSPEEGAYFTKKMFKTYDGDMQTRNKNIYQAWDFAITTGTANDWTVGCTIMQDEHDNLYVLDVNRFRSDDGIDIVDTMVEYARTWNVGLIGVEDGQIWKSLATTFTKTCEAKGYYPAYEVLKPLTDKLVRAQPLRGRMQANKLYWPARATWYENLKTEFLRFPAGTHDDQIDSLAWAIRLTLSKSAPKPPAQKELKSWKDKLSAYTENSGGGHMSA